MADLEFSAALDLADADKSLDSFAGKVDDTSTKMETAGQKGGGLISSITGLINPVTLLAGGAVALGGGLLAAGKAAGEEQAEIDQLTNTVKNNALAWDGNTEALDAVIAAGERKAFGDSELRESLGQLVTQTHDVAAATELQGLAMDLARSKNISLEQATKLVMKADQGAEGALKKLGIEVDKNATQAEILGAIHDATAGAADRWAESTEGSAIRAQASLANAVEDIGGAVLPFLSQALAGVADFMSGPEFQGAVAFLTDLLTNQLGAAIAFLTGLFAPIQAAAQPFVETLMGLVSSASQASAPLQGLGDVFSNMAGLAPTLLTGLQEIGMTIASQAVDWGLQLVKWVGDAIPGIVAGMAEYGAAIFNWITSEGIPKAAEFLMQMAQKFIDFIVPALPGMLAQLQEWGTALLGWILNEGIPKAFETLATLGQKFIEWVVPIIPPLLEKLGELGASLIGWLIGTALPMIVSKLLEWGKAFVDWLGPNIPPLLAKAAELLGALGNWLINTALPDLLANLQTWGKAFVDWVGPQIPPLLTALGQLASQIWTWLINEALPVAITKLGEFAQAFLNWVGTDVIPFIGAKLQEFGAAIWNWVTNDAVPAALRVLKSMGQAIIDGILAGLAAGKQAVIDFILGIASGAVDAVKNFLGIHSPSAVFMDLFAEVGAGAARGLAQSAPAVLAQAEQMAAGVVDAMSGLGGQATFAVAGAAPVAAGAGVTGAGASGGVGAPAITVYVNGVLTNDPKQVRILLEEAGAVERRARR